MNIGEASRASGVSVKMIRHYESIGLLAAPQRTESGYRVYREEDLRALRFIRSARDLGFPLAEVEALLRLWRDRARASGEVKRLALAHVEAIQARRRLLQLMAEALTELAEACHGDHRPDCPILAGLSAGVAAEAAAGRAKGRDHGELRHAGVAATRTG